MISPHEEILKITKKHHDACHEIGLFVNKAISQFGKNALDDISKLTNMSKHKLKKYQHWAIKDKTVRIEQPLT